MSDVYYSRVYTDRPAYADFDPPAKFLAIESIIAKRLKEHPNAICSYSGGSDVVPARDLRDCRNELCLRCGEYKRRHIGACDGCRWKEDT